MPIHRQLQNAPFKAYPPKPPGSTKTGTAQEERDYFARCLRNGGNMDNARARNRRVTAK